jgi:hypothetical protein
MSATSSSSSSSFILSTRYFAKVARTGISLEKFDYSKGSRKGDSTPAYFPVSDRIILTALIDVHRARRV